MNPMVKRFVIAGSACVALVAILSMAYGRVYAEPMRVARADLARWRDAARSYERDLEGAPRVTSRLREVSATTLGRTEEEVAHRFRTLLHETATQAGLGGITITEGRTASELNPATSRFRLQGFRAESRRTSDFAVMNGEIRGVGTLESVARLLEMCECQPWIHRVSSFSVTPVGDERSTFEVRVSAATLILPDLGPPADAIMGVTPLEPGSETAWASIVSKNVFRVPDPPAVPDPVPVAVAPAPAVEVPPSTPAYHEWRVVGVMEGTSGVRVVMSHNASGRSLVLGIGEGVLGARLVRAGVEDAVFEINGAEFVVRLGQSLADRRVVDEWDGD